MPRQWLVVKVRSPADEQKHELTEGLLALGACAVVEEADTLSTWLPAPDAAAPFEQEVRSRLEAAGGQEVRFTLEEERDWLAEWRRGLAPRRVGEHIVVTPTWAEFEAEAGDLVITIDPQMAFGTGEHASTRLVLRRMETLVNAGDRVLDMGTGSAILAIAAAHLGAAHVDAAESDGDALGNAAENIARNDGAERIALTQALVDDVWLRAHGPWDVIVGNVLSGVLRPLVPDLTAALRPGGRLLLSGILIQEAEGMRAATRLAGLSELGESSEEEWWCGAFAKSS